ncbi:MAG: hypothetical protein KI789_08230 [Hoeflea sp.]|nr:hypothetical protein [Hoeflea sp.]
MALIIVLVFLAGYGEGLIQPSKAQEGFPSYRLPESYWPSGFKMIERGGYQNKDQTLVSYYPGVNNNLRNDPHYTIRSSSIVLYPTEEWANKLVLENGANMTGMPRVNFAHSADNCFQTDLDDVSYSKSMRVNCTAGRAYFTFDVDGRQIYDGKRIIKPAPTIDELNEITRQYIAGAARFGREISAMQPTYDMEAACDYFASGSMPRHPKIAISGSRIWFRFDGTLDNFHFGCNTAEVAEVWEVWEGRVTGSGDRLAVDGKISNRVRLEGGGEYCDGITQAGSGAFNGTLADGLFSGTDSRSYETVAGDMVPMSPISCDWKIDGFDPLSATLPPGQVPPWASSDGSEPVIPDAPIPEDMIPEAGVPASGYDTPVAGGTPISPVAVAAGTLAAGGIAGLGTWLMLGQAGVGRREMLDAVGDLARGKMPSDGFDDWKAKHEAMGWTYREEDGVAVFDPPPGYKEQASTPPPVIERHCDGEVNSETGEVWSDEDGGWVGRNLYDQEKRRAGDIAAIEARNRQAVAEWDAETQALDSAIASSQRDRAARAAAEEAARIRIGDKLSRLLEADGISTEEVERMRRERDTVGLQSLYEDTLRSRMAKTSAEAAAYNREAAIYRAGELASKALLAGSKATMMAVAGPAGYIPALIGSGVLRSAEEGATVYVKSDGDKRALGTALVSGFFAGAKDGVVGRFTGLPRTGNVTKVLLPAAADAGETYVRTGDIKASMTTGLMSAAGGAAGSRMDRFGSAVAREAGQAATGATMGAVNAAVNGGSIPDAMMDGMADAIGGRLGQHVGAGQTPMTRNEIAMDLEYKAKLADARGRIDALDKAVASGDPAKIKPALQDVLEHREAKVLMKGKDVDPGLKSSFSELTQEHRTRPVMDGTAEALNRQMVTGPDGVEQPRFVMRDDNGVERPVTGADFASGSGKPGEPGVDLDMYPKGTIIDKARGRPAKGADVDQAVSESCSKLGIDRRSQEVNVTGMKGTEDLTMRPGETPDQFYARVGREKTVSAAEGTGAAEVGTHKLHAADELHGDGLGSSALAEKTRGVMKDKGRLIDPLIAGDGKAQVPEVFRRMEPVKRTSAMDVLQQLADGSIPPGTANAKFRQLTNMDIDQALPKIAGWSEGLGKWGSGSPGGMPVGPSFTGPGGASNLQQVAAAFIRNFDATKTTE